MPRKTRIECTTLSPGNVPGVMVKVDPVKRLTRWVARVDGMPGPASVAPG
jgi:hypothetical protein